MSCCVGNFSSVLKLNLAACLYLSLSLCFCRKGTINQISFPFVCGTEVVCRKEGCTNFIFFDTLHLLLHCLLHTEVLWKSLDCLFNQMVLVSGSCIWLQNLWTPGWSHVQSRNLSMALPKTNMYLKRRAQRTEKLAPTTVEIKPSIYHQTAKLGPWCV